MTWYTAKTGGDQGLIIEEETGRNVAVVYDKKDAPLLAAAPDLLEACKGLIAMYEVAAVRKTIAKHFVHKIGREVQAIDDARRAIEKAEEGAL